MPRTPPTSGAQATIQLAEKAPLPRSLADFPDMPQVRRGWAAVRQNDIFGFGEGFDLEYLNILADLQECVDDRVTSRGKMHLLAHWRLEQPDGRWTATIQAVDPIDSKLSPEDDRIVLDCVRKDIGRSVQLDDNKSNKPDLDHHWNIAFPLRDSRIYQKILSGGEVPGAAPLRP